MHMNLHHMNTQASSLGLGQSNHFSEVDLVASVLHEVAIPQKQEISKKSSFIELNTHLVAMNSMREPSKAQINWLKAFAYAKDQAKHSIRAQEHWSKVFAATQKLVKGAFDGCLVLQEGYYLEALDPCHEYAAVQYDYFQAWIDGADSLCGDMRKNYFEFIKLNRTPISSLSEVVDGEILEIKDPYGYVTDGESQIIVNPEPLRRSWISTATEDGWPRLASGVDQFTAKESADCFGVSVEGQKVLFSPNYHADWGDEIANSRHPSELIFVVDKTGQMYAGFKERGIFHHSSFLSGAPVAMAGTLFIGPKGRLLGVSNLSGHYQPAEAHCIRFLHQLRQNGVNLNKIKFIFAKPGSEQVNIFRASEWLRAYSDQYHLHYNLQMEIKFRAEMQAFQATAISTL